VLRVSLSASRGALLRLQYHTLEPLDQKGSRLEPMVGKKKLGATRRHIQVHWPAYFGLYAALVTALILLGLGLALGWYALVPFALAIILVAAYFLVSALWTAYQLHDGPGPNVMELLLSYSQSPPEAKVVCIDLGLRRPAVQIAQRLTSGQVTVIDIFNPQSNTSAALRRGRARAPRPPADPRLIWVDGRIELLPVPDRSVSAVFINQVLAEFWLPEERDRLLSEVRRILVPEGRLLLAERVRARSHSLLSSLITTTYPPADYWRDSLLKADLIPQREETLRGLIYCVRADRPAPSAAKQLALQLEYL